MLPNGITFTYNPYADESTDLLSAVLGRVTDLKPYFGELILQTQRLPYPLTTADVLSALVYIKEKDFLGKFTKFREETSLDAVVNITIPTQRNIVGRPSGVDKPRLVLMLESSTQPAKYSYFGRLHTDGLVQTVIFDFYA